MNTVPIIILINCKNTRKCRHSGEHIAAQTQVAALQGILQQLQLVNTRLDAIEQSLPQAQPHAPAATVEPRLRVDDETIVGTLAKSGCKTLKDLIMMDKEDIDDLELPRLVSNKLKMCKAEEEFDEFQEENRKNKEADGEMEGEVAQGQRLGPLGRQGMARPRRFAASSTPAPTPKARVTMAMLPFLRRHEKGTQK